MKRIPVLLLTLIMLFSLCACGAAQDNAVEKPAEEEPAVEAESNTQEEPVEGANMVNPMVEYGSLDEINNMLGGKLCHPAVMGVTGDSYWIINCGDYSIAQYMFQVNGTDYSFRFSPVYDTDISGCYVGDGTAFPGDINFEEPDYYTGDDYKLARWGNIDGQYVLMVKDGGSMDEILFKSITEEMMMLSSPVMSDGELAGYYASLEGEYYDSFSQRATATITANGSEGITIVVLWGGSAFETSRWTMHASRGEDGLLYYNDCVLENLTYDENGNESVETAEFPESGFFGELDGVLAWNGSGDEQCDQCVFERA